MIDPVMMQFAISVFPNSSPDLLRLEFRRADSLFFYLHYFIYICAQMQISPQATGVNPTVRVLQHYPDTQTNKLGSTLHWTPLAEAYA